MNTSKGNNTSNQQSSGKRKWLFVLVIGLIALSLYYQNKEENKQAQKDLTETSISENKTKEPEDVDINRLTNEKIVVDFVRKNGRLPDYYLTKNQARKLGWNSGKGNLCDVLPGKAIGGDNFANREGKLPKQKGRKYYEADINYHCGHRQADRLVFSSDGLIFISKDHYKSFHKQ